MIIGNTHSLCYITIGPTIQEIINTAVSNLQYIGADYCYFARIISKYYYRKLRYDQIVCIMILQAILFLVLTSVQSAPVRGIWLTVSGTSSPYSKSGIQQVVARCKFIGINTIYFSVWDESLINFIPAKALTDKYPFIKVNPKFIFDPLQYLSQIASLSGIKVLAWFQYGFATSYNDPQGGPILKQKPGWKGLDSSGKLAEKNNFQWMNGFLPEVQTFMIDLITSLGTSHNIDGIQGDDRLPAMPSLSGYDNYTVSVYKAQHFGKQPPVNYKDRSDLLNTFMSNLHAAIRARVPKWEIHMAPSVYPWSQEQYLQDWPTWVSRGQVDAILPQIYRYSISAYADTIRQNYQLLDATKKQQFYPGILIGVGSNTTVNAKILNDSLSTNRALGIKGQSFFYHESLNDGRVAQIISLFYHQ